MQISSVLSTHDSIEGRQSTLADSIEKASRLMLSHQFPEGYWWYTLEANESINAEYIFLTRYLGVSERETEQKIARRIQSSQNTDGSWSLFFEGPGDLSATIECYFALKLAGLNTNSSSLTRALEFIRSNGGAEKCSVFTRIHLALFGIIPWSACPVMPASMIEFPLWFPINIYEFSTWARASIVPLLVIMDQKKIHSLPDGFLSELFNGKSAEECDWSYPACPGFFSAKRFFIRLDKLLHFWNPFSIKFLRARALKKCEKWIREHLARTEDIYPAMAYGAMALHSLGYPASDPTIQKCLGALYRFRMPVTETIPAIPAQPESRNTALYQQCCISPVWDTPWMGTALLEAGLLGNDKALLKCGRWLLEKQIKDFHGDWAVKNKKGLPGGWSFEFENDYFPDVDDTIEVLIFLKKLALPKDEVDLSFERGFLWLLSMQSKNGGWAAFDVDNTKNLVNQIPFSDHGACLDRPTPDITGRMIELLSLVGYKTNFTPLKKAIRFVEKTQEDFGAWEGRWGVDYIYGTWCVLQGLRACGYSPESERIQKAASWLESVQHPDGGFGESPASYNEKKYVDLGKSVPSQTAWGLMALIASGKGNSPSASRAADFLINRQEDDGGWSEDHHTGTGFPRHFYIRYHGYRHYFPLLALAKYKNCK